MSQWLKRGREGGVEALNVHPPTEVSSRTKNPDSGIMSQRSRSLWLSWRCLDSQACGRGDPSNGSRVRYHRDHVSRLLREASWSRQQPIQRATQRDEQAIKDWYERRWPAIKKSGRGRTHDRRGATKPGCISCRWQCGSGRPVGRRRFCEYR